jgi:hypothetical protein
VRRKFSRVQKRSIQGGSGNQNLLTSLPVGCIHDHVADCSTVIVEIKVGNPAKVSILRMDSATKPFHYTALHIKLLST